MIAMVRKILLELNEEEFTKYNAIKGSLTHREAILKGLGIPTEARNPGRKPLTKKEQQRAIQRIKKIYYEIIDELEETEKGSDIFKGFMDDFRDSGYPQERASEISTLLEAGRTALFTGLRKWVDLLDISDVESYTRKAVKKALTPPTPPTVEEAYEALTKHQRDLYKEYEEELRAHNVRLYKISKEEEPAAEKPGFDLNLRMKAAQMAAGSPNSVEFFMKKLRAEA